MKDAQIKSFLDEHSDWIEKHLQKMKESAEKESSTRLSKEDIEKLTNEAKTDIPQRVEHYAKIMGIEEYGRITIKSKKQDGAPVLQNAI